MKVQMGKVTGREVRTNNDGTVPRLMLQVQFTNPNDIQTVEYVPLPGLDANPINGTRVYVLEVGADYKIAVAANDGTVPSMETGEQSIYAQNDAGALQAFIDLLKTGEIDIVGIAASIILLSSGIIEINGNTDFAVRFTALEAQMQILVGQINVLFATKANGSGSAGTLVLDLSTAKVDTVKLP